MKSNVSHDVCKLIRDSQFNDHVSTWVMFPSEWCCQVMFPSFLLPPDIGNVCPWDLSCSASFVCTRRWPVSFDFVKNPIPQISQTNDLLFVQEFIWAEIEGKNEFRSNFEDEVLVTVMLVTSFGDVRFPTPLGWIQRNFKTFILKPKLPFLKKNHKNDNYGQFPNFDEFTLNMNFVYSLKMTITMMGIYLKNFKNHI